MTGHADLTQILWAIFLIVAIIVMLRILGVQI